MVTMGIAPIKVHYYCLLPAAHGQLPGWAGGEGGGGLEERAEHHPHSAGPLRRPGQPASHGARVLPGHRDGEEHPPRQSTLSHSIPCFFLSFVIVFCPDYIFLFKKKKCVEMPNIVFVLILFLMIFFIHSLFYKNQIVNIVEGPKLINIIFMGMARSLPIVD